MKYTFALPLLVSTVLISAISTKSFATPSKVTFSCSPTVGAGQVNFTDATSGLNRIAEIDITTGDAGPGGYGIVLHLNGTSGTGEQPAKSNVKLAWAWAFGSSVLGYDNRNTTAYSATNPYIVFEVEPSEDGKTALGALTVSYSNKRSVRVLPSRYKCSSN